MSPTNWTELTAPSSAWVRGFPSSSIVPLDVVVLFGIPIPVVGFTQLVVDSQTPYTELTVPSTAHTEVTAPVTPYVEVTI